MSIGSLGRARRKNHPQYVASRRQPLPGKSLKVSPSTGFTNLRVGAVYNATLHSLELTITGSTAPGNRGPGIFERRTVEDWHRKKNSDGTLVRLLEEVLAEFSSGLKTRSYPEKKAYLDRCKPSEADAMQFLERTCARCSCWYCEFSSP